MLTPREVLEQYSEHDNTLSNVLDIRAAALGDKPFIETADGSWTWLDTVRAVNTLAARLSMNGIGRGDRIAVIGRNSPIHIFVLFAAARLGAVAVPLNPDYRVEELRYILGNCEPAAIFSSDECADKVQAALDALSYRPWLSLFDRALEGVPAALQLIGGEALSCPIEGRPEDTCVIIYTSGTTGFPKGVCHSQRVLVACGEASVQRTEIQPTDKLYVVLPLFHINALFYSICGTLLAGAAAFIKPRFSASAFWGDIATHGVTQLHVLESLALILKARPRDEFRADHGVRVAYGVRPSAARAFREEFGIATLITGYGMSEIPGFMCTPYRELRKEGTMGLPPADPVSGERRGQTRIVDESGADVAPGRPGELLAKTPIMMQGYFGDPEQTEAAFRDGWFVTGDIVEQDDEGYFRFVSRKKEIIRRRGENISALELDRILGEHPDAVHTAVAAVPSEWGEDDILVAVVPKPGRKIQAEQYRGWAAERLAAHKIPRYLKIVDALPVNSTHKVLRNQLSTNVAYRDGAIDLSVLK